MVLIIVLSTSVFLTPFDAAAIEENEWVAQDEPLAKKTPPALKQSKPSTTPMTQQEQASLRRELQALERKQQQTQSIDQTAAVLIGSLAIMTQAMLEIEQAKARSYARPYHRNPYYSRPAYSNRDPLRLATNIMLEMLNQTAQANNYSRRP